MISTNPQVDNYLEEGCGRCKLGGTPECKVHKWPQELKLLRKIALDCGLNEEIKWGVPVYTYQKHNIIIIGAFKENCVLSFFKGALLEDEEKILQFPGENSQSAKVIRFTDVKTIQKLEAVLKAYIFEAIEIEKAGLKVTPKKLEEYTVPAEFKSKLKEMPALKKAFEALTPGRQKAYLLHFSSAKQAATRISRIEKCIPNILKGKGFLE